VLTALGHVQKNRAHTGTGSPFVVYTHAPSVRYACHTRMKYTTVQDGTSAVSASNVLYCTIVLKYNIITKEKQQIFVVELIPKVAPAHS
jgi:hypothetical protein